MRLRPLLIGWSLVALVGCGGSARAAASVSPSSAPRTATLNAVPEILLFGKLYPETKPWVRRVRLRNPGPRPLALNPPECTAPFFKLTLTPVRPGWEYDLGVELVAGLAPGAYAGTIRITPSGEFPQTLLIPVAASVPPAVDVAPRRLRLPARTLTRPYGRTLVIRAATDDRLELAGAELDAPGAAVKLETVVSGRIYFLRVEFPAGWTLPDAGAALSIRVASPGLGDLVVPVSAEPPVVRGAGSEP